MKKSIECVFHGEKYEPNKARVRNALGELTASATCIIEKKEGDVRAIDIVPRIVAYDATAYQDAPGYQKALQLSTFAEATGRFDTFLTATTTSEYSKPSLRDPYIPVGEYGEEPARRLLTGLVRTIDTAQRAHGEIGATVDTDEARHAVLNHTFEGIMQGNTHDGHNITSQQGLVSIAQALALLTARKVKGYEWNELAKAIVDQEILTEFTRSIGIGLLPAFILYGRFIDPPLAAHDQEPYLAHTLRDETKASRQKTIAESRDAAECLREMSDESALVVTDEDLRNHQLMHLAASEGVACPAANRGGEITRLGRFMLHNVPA